MSATRQTDSIITVQPFNALFPVDARALSAIADVMRKAGFDPAFPLVLWRGRNIVVDGHTRLEAARLAGIDDVPVVEHEFSSEDVALTYAIHCQRDRRNLTDADILRLVSELDKRRRKGERSDLAPHGAKSGGKSADATAAAIGISARRVERTRAVLDKATPEVKAAVESGGLSLNKAYQKTRDPKTTSDDAAELSDTEKGELERCERVIEAGLKITERGKTPPREKTLSQEIEHYIRETPKHSMQLAWKAAKKSEREDFLRWVDSERVNDLPKGDERDLLRLIPRIKRALNKHPHLRGMVAVDLGIRETT